MRNIAAKRRVEQEEADSDYRFVNRLWIPSFRLTRRVATKGSWCHDWDGASSNVTKAVQFRRFSNFVS
jgi:hypothetical protein